MPIPFTTPAQFIKDFSLQIDIAGQIITKYLEGDKGGLKLFANLLKTFWHERH